jgi:hypothetical protein
VVATIPTFQPYADIEEYAVKMFENSGRGIGEKGKDNGLLIVVAVQDRKIKIEVGYELEQFVSDGFAGETIRQAITPEFRNGNYGAGLLAGTTRIINRIAEGRGVTPQNVPREAPPPRSTGTGFPWWIIVIWIIILVLNSRRRDDHACGAPVRGADGIAGSGRSAADAAASAGASEDSVVVEAAAASEASAAVEAAAAALWRLVTLASASSLHGARECEWSELRKAVSAASIWPGHRHAAPVRLFLYNKFTTQEEAIKAGVGRGAEPAAAAQRPDPNLVETVKGYAAHEAGVVQGHRRCTFASCSPPRRRRNHSGCQPSRPRRCGRLLAVVENYPQPQGRRAVPPPDATNCRCTENRLDGRAHALQRARCRSTTRSGSKFPSNVTAKMSRFQGRTPTGRFRPEAILAP